MAMHLETKALTNRQLRHGAHGDPLSGDTLAKCLVLRRARHGCACAVERDGMRAQGC